MYPIITEKGLIEKGQMEYEAFGVKLETTNNIKEVLETIEKAWLLTSNNNPILRQVIKENENPTVFYSRQGEQPTNMQEWVNYSKEAIQLYASLAPIYEKSTVYKSYLLHSPIYDEILLMAKRYFEGYGEVPHRIMVSEELYQYLEAFKILNFQLVRTTEKRIIVGKPNLRTKWEHSPGYSPLYLFGANTLALMLLTQQTMYQDENGEIPIKLNGINRKIPNWQGEILMPDGNFSQKRYVYRSKGE